MEGAESALAACYDTKCATLADAHQLQRQWLFEHKAGGEFIDSYNKFVSHRRAQKIIEVIVQATTSGHVEEVPLALQLLTWTLAMESQDQMQALKGELAALKGWRATYAGQAKGELAALESVRADAEKKFAIATKLCKDVADLSTLHAKVADALTPEDVVKFLSTCPRDIIESSNGNNFAKKFMKMHQMFVRCSADLRGLLEGMVDPIPCYEAKAQLHDNSKCDTYAVPEEVDASAICLSSSIIARGARRAKSVGKKDTRDAVAQLNGAEIMVTKRRNGNRIRMKRSGETDDDLDVMATPSRSSHTSGRASPSSPMASNSPNSSNTTGGASSSRRIASSSSDSPFQSRELPIMM